MSKKQALEIAAATVEGSAKMVLESGEHPMSLVDQVCSPRRHNHRGRSRIAGQMALRQP